MFTGIKWCMLLMVVRAEPLQWPDGAESVRVDSKVQFTDQEKASIRASRYYQGDLEDVPFQPPLDTEGFYNRPLGDGRYPVKDIRHDRRNSGTQLTPDGTLDSLHYCKCVTTPNCNFKMDSNACGPNQYLCCYNKSPSYDTSALFNEVNDDRLPNYSSQNFGPISTKPQPQQINGFGPSSPRPVLVGPGGPTGIIGPNFNGLDATPKPVLVGPGGPTGIIGPVNDKRKKNVIDEYDQGPNESAQRGVLVGPGGPTGFIGPAYNNRPILVGPGGPTGVIGPRRYPTYRNGILVGPGGPSGSIGPNRGVLVGPGGPTGRIGPWNYDY
ncbi:collagen alpha-1(X) chain-like [Aricia agestis]|uniref:collagen alpha-1(X) chain-like n=1 Tax=Aricia agestis TaxID=91739 RepID=UPI001C2062D9|nr:collagen alpha-1(X) chain-like [Aricia agestis]